MKNNNIDTDINKITNELWELSDIIRSFSEEEAKFGNTVDTKPADEVDKIYSLFINGSYKEAITRFMTFMNVHKIEINEDILNSIEKISTHESIK